jgi:hypothetical protein
VGRRPDGVAEVAAEEGRIGIATVIIGCSVVIMLVYSDLYVDSVGRI